MLDISASHTLTRIASDIQHELGRVGGVLDTVSDRCIRMETRLNSLEDQCSTCRGRHGMMISVIGATGAFIGGCATFALATWGPHIRQVLGALMGGA